MFTTDTGASAFALATLLREKFSVIVLSKKTADDAILIENGGDWFLVRNDILSKDATWKDVISKSAAALTDGSFDKALRVSTQDHKALGLEDDNDQDGIVEFFHGLSREQVKLLAKTFSIELPKDFHKKAETLTENKESTSEKPTETPNP